MTQRWKREMEASQCYNGEICEYLILPCRPSERSLTDAAVLNSHKQCISSSILSVPETHLNQRLAPRLE
jgi:hypothetical protein